jgi:hypothetical protein
MVNEIKSELKNNNRADLVPAGAFSYPVSAPKKTRWFEFLLLPEFTLLVFSAALDPLRIANQLAQKPTLASRKLSWHRGLIPERCVFTALQRTIS